MYDENTLKAIGRSAAAAVRSQQQWVHRRVESVTFPYREARIYRRRVSIDFTIPEIDAVPGSEPARYYVPLSLLKKWPPVLRLDLRTAEGGATPLLTSSQNGVVDAELLLALAEMAVADAKAGPLPPDVAEQIMALATSRGDDASRALISLVPPDKLGQPDAVHTALRNDRAFTDLAGGLRDSTVLWLRVEGSPGDREIVKFAYDIPLDWKIGEWSRQAFGLRPFKVRFESPHIGGTGSYHLVISTPAPLRITDSQLVLIEPQTAQGEPEVEQVIGVCNSMQRDETVQVANDALTLYTADQGRDARYYVAGTRTGARGEAWASLLVQKRGFPFGAAVASLSVALLLTAYFFRLAEVVVGAEASVALLLLGPALLAYLVVRPAEHVLVSQFLNGSRRVLLSSAGLPLVGASAIVLNGDEWTCALKILFGVLAALAWVAALVLAAGVWQPRGNTRRPFSRDAGA